MKQHEITIDYNGRLLDGGPFYVDDRLVASTEDAQAHVTARRLLSGKDGPTLEEIDTRQAPDGFDRNWVPAPGSYSSAY